MNNSTLSYIPNIIINAELLIPGIIFPDINKNPPIIKNNILIIPSE